MTCLLTFQNHHFVMNAEKKLIAEGFYPKTVPTPRNVNSECGFSLLLKISKDSFTKVTAAADPVSVYQETYNEDGFPDYKQISSSL